MLQKHSQLLCRDELLEEPELLATGARKDVRRAASPLHAGRAGLEHGLQKRVLARDLHFEGAVSQAIDMSICQSLTVLLHGINRVLHSLNLDEGIGSFAGDWLHSDMSAFEKWMQGSGRVAKGNSNRRSVDAKGNL